MAQVYTEITVVDGVAVVVIDPEAYVCFGSEGLVPFNDLFDLVVVVLRRVGTGGGGFDPSEYR